MSFHYTYAMYDMNKKLGNRNNTIIKNKDNNNNNDKNNKNKDNNKNNNDKIIMIK